MNRIYALLSLLVWSTSVGAQGPTPPELPEPWESVAAARFGDNAATLWSPSLEWTLVNPSWPGNAFDVVAKVVFTHVASGESRTTEMFYRGSMTWSFRFTATQLGDWTFTTHADGDNGTTLDPELRGHTGRVRVAPNPDEKIRGFITHQGNRFARQVSHSEDLEGFLPNTYMNQRHFGNDEDLGWIDITPTLTDRAVFTAYLDEAEANGCNGVFLHLNNQWFKAHVPRYDDHRSQHPDLETFEALERASTAAHRRGLYLHIWAWGDEARKWTPVGVGGINGKADRRLQRYIAARLGPLPGWVMGYGFDLNEWTEENQLREWARHLHERMGWRHMLWARDRQNEELDAKSYSHYHVRDYAAIVQDLESDRSRPHLYEERHTHERNADLDMKGTRRFRWDMAMAGGMMGFWGHFPNPYEAYPNPEQLRTHEEFWNGRSRFRLDWIRAPALAGTGVALRSSNDLRAIVYVEDADAIELDLSRMKQALSAVAIDTTAAYREIKLGQLPNQLTTIPLPRQSDWALAIGDFENEPGGYSASTSSLRRTR